MKKDIILAGVGGQGVLSIAAIIARAAAAGRLTVRQSEVHGMAQRGGAVLAHLRLADGPVFCDLVPQGGADMIIAMEPLESLRYAQWLAPDGALISAEEPLVNIPNYPEIHEVLQAIRRFPLFRLVQAAALAKEAGLPKAVNMVMVGAASPFLPLSAETLETTIAGAFAGKEPAIAQANIAAFRLGRDAAAGQRGPAQ
ncbi:MAG: indolepyruvate oxidoreductase subunit beta [Treponema sp.]|jgi:indolepyruvate ferredoxin oxidoreductase beta subunit|nr:indolepyruvate oxidoreductase subunit beta [Treponema sp.]